MERFFISYRRADNQLAIILDHLGDLSADLDAGAVVVVSDDRLRIRLLPLLHDQ